MPTNFTRPHYVRGWNEARPTSITSLCADLPPVIYCIRLDDGCIKIGWTEDLAARKRWFGKGWERILAVTPGTIEDEKALHARLTASRARGREYYRPTPEVMDVVNTMRADAGVSLL
jgi:hypothetical protein